MASFSQLWNSRSNKDINDGDDDEKRRKKKLLLYLSYSKF